MTPVRPSLRTKIALTGLSFRLYWILFSEPPFALALAVPGFDSVIRFVLPDANSTYSPPYWSSRPAASCAVTFDSAFRLDCFCMVTATAARAAPATPAADPTTVHAKVASMTASLRASPPGHKRGAPQAGTHVGS